MMQMNLSRRNTLLEQYHRRYGGVGPEGFRWDGNCPIGSSVQPVSADEASEIAQEAYIYLYSLITMDVTRKQIINSPKGSPLASTPNTFNSVREFLRRICEPWCAPTSIHCIQVRGST